MLRGLILSSMILAVAAGPALNKIVNHTFTRAYQCQTGSKPSYALSGLSLGGEAQPDILFNGQCDSAAWFDVSFGRPWTAGTDFALIALLGTRVQYSLNARICAHACARARPCACTCECPRASLRMSVHRCIYMPSCPCPCCISMHMSVRMPTRTSTLLSIGPSESFPIENVSAAAAFNFDHSNVRARARRAAPRNKNSGLCRGEAAASSQQRRCGPLFRNADRRTCRSMRIDAYMHACSRTYAQAYA